MARWLLPEGITDVLPHEARRIEHMRRVVLDLFRAHGYELVMPPLLEYLDSLLTGLGADLDLKTFKLVDQLSGRMLGLRADTTPQVARIDAHILNRPGVARLCYAGSVLHARPAHALAVRQPLQVGAELYGFAGAAADFEVQALAVAALRAAGLSDLRFDFGHTGIVRLLLAEVPQALLESVTTALAAKDLPALTQLAPQLPPLAREHLPALARLHGGVEVLAEARRRFKAIAGMEVALNDLEAFAQRCGADAVSFDLAELHGYRYYTGVNFAVYMPDVASALLRGGRYDNIGKIFGRQRPATGFSIDMREVVAAANGTLANELTHELIAAPADADVALEALIQQLRGEGRVVARQLDAALPEEPAATHRLVREGATWRLVSLS